MSRRHLLAHAGWGLGGGLHPMPSGHLRLRHRPESRHVHRQLQRGLLLPCSLRLRHCGAVPHRHVPCNHWRRVVGGLLAVHCWLLWVHCGEVRGPLHGTMQRWVLLPRRVHQLHLCALPSWSVPCQHGRRCRYRLHCVCCRHGRVPRCTNVCPGQLHRPVPRGLLLSRGVVQCHRCALPSWDEPVDNRGCRGCGLQHL
jgi:hypothetical protein